MPRKKPVIKVLPFFRDFPPKPNKLDMKEDLYWDLYTRHVPDFRKNFRILVDRNGWLVDGYANYLVMQKYGDDNYAIDVYDDPIMPDITALDKDGETVHVRVSMSDASKLYRGRRFVARVNGRLGILTATGINVFSPNVLKTVKVFVLP